MNFNELADKLDSNVVLSRVTGNLGTGTHFTGECVTVSREQFALGNNFSIPKSVLPFPGV